MNDFRPNPPAPSTHHGVRQVTLHKSNDNQSFGFVIISSQNKAGATVGKCFSSIEIFFYFSQLIH